MSIGGLPDPNSTTVHLDKADSKVTKQTEEQEKIVGQANGHTFATLKEQPTGVAAKVTKAWEFAKSEKKTIGMLGLGAGATVVGAGLAGAFAATFPVGLAVGVVGTSIIAAVGLPILLCVGIDIILRDSDDFGGRGPTPDNPLDKTKKKEEDNQPNIQVTPDTNNREDTEIEIKQKPKSEEEFSISGKPPEENPSGDIRISKKDKKEEHKTDKTDTPPPILGTESTNDSDEIQLEIVSSNTGKTNRLEEDYPMDISYLDITDPEEDFSTDISHPDIAHSGEDFPIDITHPGSNEGQKTLENLGNGVKPNPNASESH